MKPIQCLVSSITLYLIPRALMSILYTNQLNRMVFNFYGNVHFRVCLQQLLLPREVDSTHIPQQQAQKHVINLNQPKMETRGEHFAVVASFPGLLSSQFGLFFCAIIYMDTSQRMGGGLRMRLKAIAHREKEWLQFHTLLRVTSSTLWDCRRTASQSALETR